MSVEHVTGLAQFHSIVRQSGNKLVVVDFHAVWCGPCKAIAPHYESLARRYQGRCVFLKVDVDEAEDVARHSSVSAMPTFHFYRRGTRVAEFSGADPSQLDRTIEQHAPTSADVSFSGEGNRLGNTSAAQGEAGAGAVGVNVPGEQGQEQQGGQGISMREAMAMAAARRMRQQQAEAQAAIISTEGVQATGQNEAEEKANGKQPSAGNKSEKNDVRLKVNQTFAKQMINEMGFPRVRAEKALILTGNKSLEVAVEWCFEHADDADIDEPLKVVSSDSASGSGSGAASASDGAATSSSNRPKLSVEEAKRRADELFSKARAKREAEEKREAIEREKNRVKSGKEVAAARAKLQDAERKRMVEERRRQKREELEERQRVRNMLKDDKEVRHQRFRMPDSNNASGQNVNGAAPSPAQQQQQQQRTSTTKVPGKGKIQFRLPDGSRTEAEFNAEQTVGDVVKFLSSNYPDLGTGAIKLSQQYPRRLFTQEDYGASLKDVKLLPRGVLVVSFS